MLSTTPNWKGLLLAAAVLAAVFAIAPLVRSTGLPASADKPPLFFSAVRG
jgi:hypothetical protein